MSFGGGIGESQAEINQLIRDQLDAHNASQNREDPVGLTRSNRLVTSAEHQVQQQIMMYPDDNENFKDCRARLDQWKKIQERTIESVPTQRRMPSQQKSNPFISDGAQFGGKDVVHKQEPRLNIQELILNKSKQVHELFNNLSTKRYFSELSFANEVRELVGEVYSRNDADSVAISVMKRAIDNWPHGSAKRAGLGVIKEKENTESQPSPHPTVFSASPLQKIGEQYRLSQTQINDLNKIYAHNPREAKKILELWSACCDFRRPFPLKSFLAGVKIAKPNLDRLLEIKNAKVDQFRKEIAPVLRHAMVDWAGFGEVSLEATEYLTLVNLWFDQSVGSQMTGIKKLNQFKQVIGEDPSPMSPDDMIAELAFQKMSQRQIKRLDKLVEPTKLKEVKDRLVQSNGAYAIAQAVGDNPYNPTSKTARACRELKQLFHYDQSRDKSSSLRPERVKELSDLLEKISQMQMLLYLNQPLEMQYLIKEAVGNIGEQKEAKLLDFFHEFHKSKMSSSEFMDYLGKTYSEKAKTDFLKVYNQMSSRCVKNLNNITREDFQAYEEADRMISALLRQLSSVKNMLTQRPQAINKRMTPLNLKTKATVVDDGNCGFSALAVATGCSPGEIRKKASQVASDIVSQQNKEFNARNVAYKKKITNAAEMIDKAEGLVESPAKRAEMIKIDAVTGTVREGQSREECMMERDDLHYVSIAENVPIVLMCSPPLNGKGIDSAGIDCVTQYFTPDGKFHPCASDEDRYNALALLKENPSAIALYLDIENGFTAHYFPLDPTGLLLPERPTLIPEPDIENKDNPFMSLQSIRGSEESFRQERKQIFRIEQAVETGGEEKVKYRSTPKESYDEYMMNKMKDGFEMPSNSDPTLERDENLICPNSNCRYQYGIGEIQLHRKHTSDKSHKNHQNLIQEKRK